jgi:hypothetical protein
MVNLPNPMLNQLSQLNGLSQQVKNLNQIKNMMNLLRNANNPQAMLQQMIQNNPQIKEIMNYINMNGGDPQQAFYKMAQEKGINPNEILQMLK